VGGVDGDSPDPPTIDANVTLTENARIGIAEGGYLAITGHLELNGTLEYFDTTYYNPNLPIGFSRTLIAAEGGISGRFATHDFFALADGRSWFLDYPNDSVRIRVVEAVSGEYNGNGRVEQTDLDLVLLNWGQAAAPPPDGWMNELPGGLIDQEELDRVLLGWGDRVVFPSQGAVGVPEPGSIVLIVICLIGPILTRGW
jgi:hypothetical protein